MRDILTKRVSFSLLIGSRSYRSSGYNVSPFDVESAIMKHPSVMEVAVIGVPDEYRGESVKAYVYLKKSSRGK